MDEVLNAKIFYSRDEASFDTYKKSPEWYE